MRGERPWLLLDLAGVLLDFVPQRRWDLIAGISGLPASMVSSRIAAAGIAERLDTGHADGPALASFLSGLCGHALDETEAWRLWLSPFSVAPAMAAVPVLSAGYRLGVFSNNPAAITRLLDASRFEAMLFSSDLGVRKPDARSYALAEARLGVPGEKLTFVDDGEGNVEAARRAGWRAILHERGSVEGLLASLAA